MRVVAIRASARISAVSAAIAIFALPGIAAADPSPAVTGSCAATLHDEHGTTLTDDHGSPLTVDIGALLNQPGAVDIGLGSPRTNPNEPRPLVSLPVGTAAKALGLAKLSAVGTVLAEGVCPAVQNTVNTLSAPVQQLTEPAPVAPEPEPSPEPPPVPPQPTEPAPVTAAPSPGTAPPAATAPDPIADQFGAPGEISQLGDVGGAISGVTGPWNPLPGAALSATPPLHNPNTPPADAPAPVLAPGLNPAETPGPAAESGTGVAIPAAGDSVSPPLVIGVLALAVIVTALSRSWRARA